MWEGAERWTAGLGTFEKRIGGELDEWHFLRLFIANVQVVKALQHE